MAYEREMIQTLIDNDKARIDAIRRLNTPGSYIGSHEDASHDKLVATLNRNFRRSHGSMFNSNEL